MTTETTVLLVDVGTLPSSLEEQLTRREVFVEHAVGAEVGQVAPVLVPDLIVQSGRSDLTMVLDLLKDVIPRPSYVVLADRATIRKLRAEEHPQIGALIPQDLPVAAIAHRLSTMARRSAEGQAIDPLQRKAPARPKKPDENGSERRSAPAKKSDASSAVPVAASARKIGPASARALESKKPPRPDVAEDGHTQPGPVQAAPTQAAPTQSGPTQPGPTEVSAQIGAAEPRKGAAEDRQEQQAARKQRAEEERQKRLEEERHKAAQVRQKRIAEAARKAEETKRRAAARAIDAPKRPSPSEPGLGARPSSSRSRPPPLRRPSEAPRPRVSEAPAQASSAQLNPGPLQGGHETASFFPKSREEERALALKANLGGRPNQARTTKRASSAVTAKKERLFDDVEELPMENRVPSTAPPPPPSGRPPSVRPRAMGLDDELSMVAQLPVELRLPLTTFQERLSQTRLAFLDTDLTRADSLAGALRRKSIEVFPVTPDVARTRWPLLRRFAPQGLVVDEKSMARTSAEWVETFRGDPFLRHVPLVVLRYSQLFRTQGDIDLEPLLRLIEPLGLQERELLNKLAPARQVELKLGQITPYSLVQLLTGQDKNIRLDCRGGGERIVWPLGPGYAGKAKLLKEGDEKVVAKLSPEDSMKWLLSHDDCDVTVHEHDEPLAHASESRDAEQLLIEMTDALGRPARHQSVLPDGQKSIEPVTPSYQHPSLHPSQYVPLYGSVPAPSLPPPGDPALGATLPAHAMLASPLAGQTLVGHPPPMAVPSDALSADGASSPASATQTTSSTPAPHSVPVSSGREDEPLPRSGNSNPRLGSSLAAIKNRLHTAVVSGWRAYQQLWSPLDGRINPDVQRGLVIGTPLVVSLLLVLFLSSLGGSDVRGGAQLEVESGQEGVAAKGTEGKGDHSSRAKPGAASTRPDPSGGDATVGPKGSSQAGDTLGLWKIAPDSQLDSCEVVLGPAVPRGESPERSLSYWKEARRLLMKGDSREALERMCLAGLFDTKGPAAEGLAEYYLAERSLAEAERWVRLSLDADGERRRSLEILGDIESQKGNPEEARKLWLETMRLTGTETSVLQAISRKLLKDARLAERGGALPRAERALRRAATLDPESAIVAARLAEIFLLRDQLPAATLWAQRAMSLDPNDTGATLLSGRIAEKQGKQEEAVKLYQSIPPGDDLYKDAQSRLARLR